MGPYLIDEGYGCLLLLLLFQMVWMVMTMGSKKSTPLHPLQHALKKRKRTTLILTILLSRGHSWIFHR